jgi:hypothetical protein
MERRTGALLLSSLAFACAAEDGSDDDGAADTVTLGTSDGTTDPNDDGSSAGDDESTATVASQESGADSGGASSGGGDSSEGEAESEGEGTTGGPTSGPGVLPGETGLEAFCRRYVECGGTYYDGEQACIDASYDYWGDCPSRAAALDEFGACMSEIECTDWSPDAYNPASTPCAEQWQGVSASEPCD